MGASYPIPFHVDYILIRIITTIIRAEEEEESSQEEECMEDELNWTENNLIESK